MLKPNTSFTVHSIPAKLCRESVQCTETVLPLIAITIEKEENTTYKPSPKHTHTENIYDPKNSTGSLPAAGAWVWILVLYEDSNLTALLWNSSWSRDYEDEDTSLEELTGTVYCTHCARSQGLAPVCQAQFQKRGAREVALWSMTCQVLVWSWEAT